MNLDELQSVRDRERQTDKLQQLRESFYADAGEFIQQLREQRERAAERADDPFDAPEVNQLSDEIDTAEQTVEAIYEKRVGKIVKAASFAAADLPAESDGMTAEEQQLFELLVDDIKANRQHVLDVLAGGTDGTGDGSPDERESAEPRSADETANTDHSNALDRSSDTEQPGASDQPGTSDQPDTTDQSSTADQSADRSPPDPGNEQSPSGDGVGAAEVMSGSEQSATSDADRESVGNDRSPEQSGSESEPDPDVRNDGGSTAADATDATDASVERETVRITADVGSFLGLDDREYDLSEDDVVTLPSTNAAPLVKRDAAERLE